VPKASLIVASPASTLGAEMKILVTGSSGHLGEALMRVLPADGHEVIGLDVLDSAHTDVVGSIADGDCVRRCVAEVEAVVHTATLHKPHVGSHTRSDFVETSCAPRASSPSRTTAAKSATPTTI
jgi:NAD(P)-dependent dehydrogenase (short-subunit alcohol dehydrogenase family)